MFVNTCIFFLKNVKNPKLNFSRVVKTSVPLVIKHKKKIIPKLNAVQTNVFYLNFVKKVSDLKQ